MRLGEATLGPGTISHDVRDMQLILKGQGYDPGPIDGNFGPHTQAAVQAFQKSKGLVPDGIVGALTWAALRGRMQAEVQPLPTSAAPKPEPKPVHLLTPSIPVIAAGMLAIGIILVNSGKR